MPGYLAVFLVGVLLGGMIMGVRVALSSYRDDRDDW